MYDVSKLPAVRELIEQAEQNLDPAPAVEYARAPQAPSVKAGAGRPPAIQEATR